MSLPYPVNEDQLMTNCTLIEGMSFSQLAKRLQIAIPSKPTLRKGWTGLAIEMALGATAGSKPLPDFNFLGIELKTIPINEQGNPAESTFITSIPLLTIHQQQWKTSQCYHKLKKVLWIPVEGEKTIPFEHRRIGRGVLWSPNEEDEAILASDWTELTTMITTGRLEEITASMGNYLQVRPKAANARSLCYGFDADGNKIQTLPRGFYLRSAFTQGCLRPLQAR